MVALVVEISAFGLQLLNSHQRVPNRSRGGFRGASGTVAAELPGNCLLLVENVAEFLSCPASGMLLGSNTGGDVATEERVCGL
jgi:hypothetical protein